MQIENCRAKELTIVQGGGEGPRSCYSRLQKGVRFSRHLKTKISKINNNEQFQATITSTFDRINVTIFLIEHYNDDNMEF